MLSYVLITPARNEESFVENTLNSVVNQTILPRKWIIVDDGSTDRTAAIVERVIDRYPWIKLVRRSHSIVRSFASKVLAFNAGYACLVGTEYDIIGSLDADVSFAPDYVEFLLDSFDKDHNLGVAGTFFIEQGYDSSRDS